MTDFFHGDVYHLGATHAITEIVHLAALRTMANRHPMRGFLVYEEGTVDLRDLSLENHTPTRGMEY